MKNTLIHQLAHYVSHLRYEDLPGEVIEKAKICLLDSLGLAVAGFDIDVSQLSLRATKFLSNPGNSTIWIDGYKGKAMDCAFANSVLAHALFHDDWHPASHAHIGVSVNPVALTLGEEINRSGKEILLATVVGYEVEGRTGVMSVPAFTRGFRASSVYGFFGSTAAAAKLMNLETEPFKNALACAGNVTGGVLQSLEEGSMEWAVVEGFGCRAGILAAILAKEGLRGSDYIMEGRKGVNICFSGTNEGQEELVKDLGDKYQITDVCFKRFPSGGANQGSIYVALDLARKYQIDYRQIKEVRVKIPHTGTHERMNYAGITYTGPFPSIDACFISKPFAIAATLKNAALDIEIVLREQKNPEITDLAHKVKLEEVKGMSGWTLSMDVELKDGTVLHGDGRNIDQQHIYPDRQLATEKFVKMAKARLGEEWTQEIVDLVFGLETLDNVKPVIEKMVRP